MTTRFARTLVQLTIIVALAAGAGACQTIADLDPTGLLSEDATPASDNSAASSPELANIPGAPTVTDDQKDLANSLNAAGTQAQYSADALRAGTEAAATAPVAAAPVTQEAVAVPTTAMSTAPAAAVATNAPPATEASPAPVSGINTLPPGVQPAPVQVAAASPIPVSTAPPIPTSTVPPISVSSVPPVSPVQADSLASMPAAPPPGAEPAVPAIPPSDAIHSTMMTPPAMSDAALGFKPSTAPPLDASISNFVSQPIISRYRQTASLASSAGPESSLAAVPGRGGPDMSGAVIANLDAQPGSVVAAMAGMNGGVPPTAVIYFAGDGVTLSAAGRAQIRAAVAAFKAGGEAGTIRVVGHASSRTANMPVEKHLEFIFEKSQKRAMAVMQELVHQGVPADKVQMDAVGDSQPIYYESMPKGEDGNRRAEIYVQG